MTSTDFLDYYSPQPPPPQHHHQHQTQNQNSSNFTYLHPAPGSYAPSLHSSNISHHHSSYSNDPFSGSIGGVGSLSESSLNTTSSSSPTNYNMAVSSSSSLPSLSSSSTISYDDEPPLLDELGIHPGDILNRTLAVSIPFKSLPPLHQESEADLAGPLVFCLLLGSGLLLVKQKSSQYHTFIGESSH